MTTYQLLPSVSLLHDAPRGPRERGARKRALERHFSDLYVVMIHKLAEYALSAETQPGVEDRLRACLDELVATRRRLESAD